MNVNPTPADQTSGAMIAEADVGRRKRQRARDDRVVGRLARAFGQARNIELRARRAAARAHGAAHGANCFFEHDVEVARADHVGRLQQADEHRRADGGMACERQLARGREDARARGVDVVARALQEHGLRQVELARDGLHLRLVEIVGVAHHRERIAAEPRLREHVERVELLSHDESPGALLTGRTSRGKR